MMMEFNYTDGAHFATNSIKPVRITEFDVDCFELFMSKGDLYLDFPIHMQFETFEKAVKWAEHKVGIKLILEDA